MRYIILLMLSLSACSTGALPRPLDPVPGPGGPLQSGASWYWQLTGTLRTDIAAQVYDIDLFENTADTIADLQQRGIYVICYFSAGSWEDWRSDAARYPGTALGRELEGWPGERWVDIRDAEVRSILEARLDLASQKGCDGVEPDNVDGWSNDTGFDLTATDQVAFNRWLADAAHARGLTVGLKNDPDQVGELVDDFDFAVNEQCLEFDECDRYEPFVAAGKAVFLAEYPGGPLSDAALAEACSAARGYGLSLLVLPPALDGSWWQVC